MKKKEKVDIKWLSEEKKRKADLIPQPSKFGTLIQRKRTEKR